MKDELRIKVYADLTVSDETAELCCKLMGIWLDANEDADIVVTREPTEDGWRHRLMIKKGVHHG